MANCKLPADCTYIQRGMISTVPRVVAGWAQHSQTGRPTPKSKGQLNTMTAGASRLAFRPAPSRTTNNHDISCSAVYEPYPFVEDEFYRTRLSVAVRDTHTTGGHLFLTREDEVRKPGLPRDALPMVVAGDSLSCICTLIQSDSRSPNARPMALDLLWQVLERGQEISKKEWKLVRVAVVAMTDSTYIARVFFGDADGNVVWDCDCRPSDACWLALKEKCPIYVRRDIWAENKSEMPVINKQLHTGDTLTKANEVVASGRATATQVLTGVAAMTTVRTDDPELVKLLKREMEVALHEEDYTTAARIRDHPFMQLHMRMLEHLKEGRREQAAQLSRELEIIIRDSATTEADAHNGHQ